MMNKILPCPKCKEPLARLCYAVSKPKPTYRRIGRVYCPKCDQIFQPEYMEVGDKEKNEKHKQ